jgi:hypothetical protein
MLLKHLKSSKENDYAYAIASGFESAGKLN